MHGDPGPAASLAIASERNAERRQAMSEFLGNYGFFILIVVVMLGCHLLHFGGHGRHGGDRDRDQPPDGRGGHRH